MYGWRVFGNLGTLGRKDNTPFRNPVFTALQPDVHSPTCFDTWSNLLWDGGRTPKIVERSQEKLDEARSWHPPFNTWDRHAFRMVLK